MEKNLTDATGGALDARNRIEVLWYPMLLPPTIESGGFDFPNHDLTVLTTGCDDGVVEGRPSSVEDGAGVAAGQWNDIWKPGWKSPGNRAEWARERQDCKRSSARGIPVQTDITLGEIGEERLEWISEDKTYARRSDQIGIPGAARDLNIV